MAADLKFRLVSDDSLAPDPHTLTPGILYRGMAVYQQYSELYVKNEGDAALTNPSHTLYKVTSTGVYVLCKSNRMVSSDAGGTSPLVAWNTGSDGAGVSWSYLPGTLLGPTNISASMAVNTIYYLHTRHRIGVGETIQTVQMRHIIGGS